MTRFDVEAKQHTNKISKHGSADDWFMSSPNLV